MILPRMILPALLLFVVFAAPGASAKPNVIIVITDDQGYGDLSCHGNPVLKTPHLDRLHAESIRFTDFHVAPMCTPTRGQLMSGVDCLRNSAMNVSSGRAMLRRELPTMANVFAAGGYRCGLFGKWHLGDNYPYRPQDRGFHETVWYPSSHIGSAPDFWNNHYFNDTYYHNGRRERFGGYTTDVFFGEAMKWMRARAAARQPFFCYLPTAAAHGPLFVPQKYRDLYKDQKPNVARFFGMIANIDENMGRLEAFLRETGLRDHTIVIFMTDNGGTVGVPVFNAGMRGRKIELYEGGHRVPCFIRWPGGKLRAPGDVGGLTQAQDLLPTLAELCGLKSQTAFDGANLADVLRGAREVPDRTLVSQFSRMDRPSPQRGDACVMWRRWRLIHDRELYDLATDPQQKQNVIGRHPDVAARLRAHYAKWWDGVAPRVDEAQRIVIGHAAENPALLSPCEWFDVFLDQSAQVRRGGKKERCVASGGRGGGRLRVRVAPLAARGRRDAYRWSARAPAHRRRVSRRRGVAHRQGAAEDRRLRREPRRLGGRQGRHVHRETAGRPRAVADMVLRRRGQGTVRRLLCLCEAQMTGQNPIHASTQPWLFSGIYGNTMKIIRLLIAIFTFVGLVWAVPAAPRDVAPEQLQQLLKRFPDADANKDGTLTLEEARAYRQKMTGKRGGQGGDAEAKLPTPTHADVKYGPHERNVLDLWLAKSDKPTPLVVFIHGGGFVRGGKSGANPDAIKRCLDAGVSFMAINYRFRQHAPIQDILRDAARAIQFVRHHAAQYNLDPKRVASYGGSAGAGTSLWLAVHDDLADPKSDDPVLRQSSRIAAAGCMNGQATYDMTEWEKLIGKFQPEWIRGEDEDVKFYHFKSRDDFKTPEGRKVLADCSMISQITKDDPPIIMTCSIPDGEPRNRGELVHHPRHANAVKQRCDEVGVKCEIYLRESGTTGDVVGFLLKQLGVEPAATKKESRRTTREP
ncbi:MAG: sulfatase-like hydrolase/transferase [Verrucomicrobiae bacterium]|nr:sulfatase-like hydrolase/transferase [Verrucomicrobiae bacterium]